jgi:hypothetical protein
MSKFFQQILTFSLLLLGAGEVSAQQSLDLLEREVHRFVIDLHTHGKEIPLESWIYLYSDFQKSVYSLKQPLAHGTQTNYVQGILEAGLGGTLPENSWSPNSNYFWDLKIPYREGWMGALAFATRGDFSSFLVNSEKITGKEGFDRFYDSNPTMQKYFWIKPLMRWGLNRHLDRYIKVRGQSDGYPAYLVFDGEGEMELRRVNKMSPAEVSTKAIARGDQLKIALVPAQVLAVFEKDLRDHGRNDVRVYPLELFEVEAIRHYGPCRRLFGN